MEFKPTLKIWRANKALIKGKNEHKSILMVLFCQIIIAAVGTCPRSEEADRQGDSM
jgi:hypothetical protein